MPPKKRTVVILVIITVLVFISCSLNQYFKHIEDLFSNDNSYPKSTLSAENENTTTELDIYGVWSLDKVVMKTGLTDNEDKEGYIGYQMEYSSEFLRLGDEKYYNPEYIFSTVTVPEFVGDGDYRAPNFYYFITEEGIQIDGVYDYDENEYWFGLPIQCFEIKFSKTSLSDNFAIPIGTKGMILNKDTILLGIWGESVLAHRIK